MFTKNSFYSFLLRLIVLYKGEGGTKVLALLCNYVKKKIQQSLSLTKRIAF